jgi:hypothetical protein
MRLLEVLLMTAGGLWQGLRQDFNLLEIVLIAGGLWLWRRGRLPKWRVPVAPRRPWMWALAIAAGAVTLRLALIPLMGVPVPVVSDEFSHMLLADTLLHGRASNPTHVFWQHFETLQVIQQPHYGSDYFPGHAAVITAARWAVGSPWAAILFECGVFLAVLYWMLRGWMPARWALFGLVLAALRFAIGSYWVNAYHGGFLPAIGGALVAGSFPRLRRRATAGGGFVLGLGLAILVLTRPFEGALFSVPFLVMLLWGKHLLWRKSLRIAIPVLIVTGVALGLLGMYFARVTGSPWVTAYQINQKTYGWPMGLAWTKPPQIEHRHIELRRYYEYELGEREKVDGPVDFVEYLTFRLQEYWRFFIGPVLTIPLLMFPQVWRRRRTLVIGVMGGVTAILLEGAASPHYLAPAAAVIIAIIVECCRHLRARRIEILPMLPAAMLLVLALRISAQTFGLPYTQELNYQSWCCKQQGNLSKSRVEAALRAEPGDHLVFVKAKTDPANLFQWIYNEADIDAARIVWARDLGGERNAALRAYFSTRRVWMLDPNVQPAKYEEIGPRINADSGK